MKTLQELYTEVMNSDALKTEFLALTTPEQVVAFAEKNGCNATVEEIMTFFEEKLSHILRGYLPPWLPGAPETDVPRRSCWHRLHSRA